MSSVFLHFNTLSIGRSGDNFKSVTFEHHGHFLWHCLRWMPQNTTDDKSILVQVIACCLTAPSHYLNQCWPRSTAPLGHIKWYDYYYSFKKFQYTKQEQPSMPKYPQLPGWLYTAPNSKHTGGKSPQSPPVQMCYQALMNKTNSWENWGGSNMVFGFTLAVVYLLWWT